MTVGTKTVENFGRAWASNGERSGLGAREHTCVGSPPRALMSPPTSPPLSLVMLIGQPNLVGAFARAVCRPTRRARPSAFRSRPGAQGARRTGPGEYSGCCSSQTHLATITRCVFYHPVCLLLAGDCRLLLELQVSYDGLKPDGKYGMVFEGHLISA